MTDESVRVPTVISRNMKSRALAHGIDPVALEKAWPHILAARPLAYQIADSSAQNKEGQVK